jgi:hypothetical protein
MSLSRWVLVSAIVAGALVLAAVAFAVPPSNDNRDDAQLVAIPSKTSGTTAESSREPAEPAQSCGSPGGSVWYRVEVPTSGRLAISLQAQGQLGAAVDASLRQRAALTNAGCAVTDESGLAELSFPVKQGETYLVRVAQSQTSPAGSFDLEVQFEAPTPRGPGQELPRRGAAGRLNTVLNPAAAYSTRFADGRPYRINLSAGNGQTACAELQVFEPGTRDFDSDEPLFVVGCEGYKVFTPGPGDGGRYSLVARASRERRGDQPYRLEVAPAGRDDVAPGVDLSGSARGRVDAHGADVVDLYSFEVERRSDVTLVLKTRAGLNLQLLRESGRRMQCACDRRGGRVRARLARGRYFAMVRARPAAGGAYRLGSIFRTITRSKITINRRVRGSARPGTTVPIDVQISPRVAGPVSIIVYRFDPVEGWRFSQRFRRDSRDGHVTAPLRLPTRGRWRARAVFHGTRAASESRTRYAFVTAVDPIGGHR